MSKKKTVLESSIQDKILRWLEQLPKSYVRKIITANKSTVDVLMCLDGQFIAFEIKAPGKKPTALQLWNLRQVANAGGYAFWVDNLEDLKILISYKYSGKVVFLSIRLLEQIIRAKAA